MNFIIANLGTRNKNQILRIKIRSKLAYFPHSNKLILVLDLLMYRTPCIRIESWARDRPCFSYQ